VARRLLTVLSLALLAALAAPVSAQAPAPDVPAIERIVRDYLLKNPEVILEAIENLEKRRSESAQGAAKAAIAERRAEILDDPDSPVAGNPGGDIAIVEFFDYRCPYCKQVVPTLAQLLKEDTKLRLVHKELPILGPDSLLASRAALAARKQNKYHPMHAALMRLRTLDEASILKAATEQGLDANRLKADMQSPEVEESLDRNRRLARALNITGTPAFIIGDALVPGAINLRTLKSLVAEARAKK
jgi:protein-disulfide isomerase